MNRVVEDGESRKDRLRLRRASTILSNPGTGYREDRAAGMNLSPVLNVRDGTAFRGRNR
jgi:hypothetical protein